jgi:hypothetical protein
MNEHAAILAIVGFIFGLILILMVGPIFTIWSLNHLFELAIPISFKSYCAVVWLMTVLHGIRLNYNNNNRNQNQG